MEEKEKKKFFEDVVIETEADHEETWQEREERERLHEAYLMTCGKPYC